MPHVHNQVALKRRPLETWKSANDEVWKDFLGFYEVFTDILCVAAKDGCTDELEKEYRLVRQWFKVHYHEVADRLCPYLEPSACPKGPRLTLFAKIGKLRCVDSVEELFFLKSVTAILSADSGDLIARVTNLSDAVYRCNLEYQT